MAWASHQWYQLVPLYQSTTIARARTYIASNRRYKQSNLRHITKSSIQPSLLWYRLVPVYQGLIRPTTTLCKQPKRQQQTKSLKQDKAKHELSSAQGPYSRSEIKKGVTHFVQGSNGFVLGSEARGEATILGDRWRPR
jgi:hypothetical protein